MGRKTEAYIMSAFPHPPRGDKEFPRSRGWSGASWAHVIDHHIKSHAENPGGDYIIGFDDSDRLCVTCYGEKGYATRIPLPLVSWVDREMEAAGVTPLPNHPRQFRLERGPGRSRLSDEPVDLAALKAEVAAKCGVETEDLIYFPREDLVNLNIDGEGPLLLRETALDRHAVAWMEREENNWQVFYGVIDPGEADKIRGHWAAKDVRQIRGGSVINWMEMKLQERVDNDAEIAQSLVEMRAEQDTNESPDGP
jgi:hypothetical protein